MKVRAFLAPAAVLGVVLSAQAALAATVEFNAFVIRNANSDSSAPTITENVAGDGFAATTPKAGQKVGYGTSAFNGAKLNSFDTVNFHIVNTTANPGVIAYLNFWVTDGTNYAIISSENDYRGTDFQTRNQWKVFETNLSNLDWLFDSGTGARDGSQYLTRNGGRVTLADFKDGVTLASPPSFPWPNVGTGAPKAGYGFNVVFGDTAANFVGGFSLDQLTISQGGSLYSAGAVPLPAAAASGAALIAGSFLRRRR